MWTIIRYTFSRLLGQVLGWGIALALLGVYGIIIHDSFVKPETQQQYLQLIASYPPELMSFFGDMNDLFSAGGYLNMVFFSYMPIILGIFSITNSTAMLAGDEEKGTLDLVLAHPVSRAQLFWGRLAAFTIAMVCILGLTWVGFVLPLSTTSLDATPVQILYVLLSLLAAMMLFGMLALLCSMLFPSQRLAAMVSGLVLVASYFLTSIGRLNPDLEDVERLFPLHYYQGGYAAAEMNWGWFAGLLGIALAFALVAWWRFEGRDVRVAGEGNWGFIGALIKKKDKISKA